MIARGRFMWAFTMLLIFAVFIIPWTAALYFLASLLQLDVTLPQNQQVYLSLAVAIPAILYLVYMALGLGQTFFDVWDNKEGQATGDYCITCQEQGKAGQEYNGSYICDACIKKRYKDLRFTGAPIAIMLGIGIIVLGVFTVLNPQEAGPVVIGESTETIWTMSNPLIDPLRPYFSVIMGIGFILLGLGLSAFGLRWISRIFSPIEPATQEKIGIDVANYQSIMSRSR